MSEKEKSQQSVPEEGDAEEANLQRPPKLKPSDEEAFEVKQRVPKPKPALAETPEQEPTSREPDSPSAPEQDVPETQPPKEAPAQSDSPKGED